jgi:hypothetical protein
MAHSPSTAWSRLCERLSNGMPACQGDHSSYVIYWVPCVFPPTVEAHGRPAANRIAPLSSIVALNRPAASRVSARQCLADSLPQSLRWTALDQESVGPGSERLFLTLRAQRQHNDSDLRPLALDAPRGLQTIHPPHSDVHQYGIGALLFYQPHALLRICCLADTCYFRPMGEQGLEALTHCASIIHNQYPHRLQHGTSLSLHNHVDHSCSHRTAKSAACHRQGD